MLATLLTYSCRASCGEVQVVRCENTGGRYIVHPASKRGAGCNGDRRLTFPARGTLNGSVHASACPFCRDSTPFLMHWFRSNCRPPGTTDDRMRTHWHGWRRFVGGGGRKFTSQARGQKKTDSAHEKRKLLSKSGREQRCGNETLYNANKTTVMPSAEWFVGPTKQQLTGGEMPLHTNHACT